MATWMRKSLLGFLACLGCLTACGDGLAGEKEVKIGVVVIDLKNSFYIRMKEAGDVAAKDYGVSTNWQSADGSLEKQISIIENFIEQKVDVILLDPLDANGLLNAINQAADAGIAVICMGNKLNGRKNYNSLYPDYENGYAIGKAVATALDGEGEVALFIGSVGNYCSDQRENGYRTAFMEFPGVDLISVQPTNFDNTEAQKIAENWLNNYPDLKAICTVNDTLNLTAMSVFEAAGKTDVLYGCMDGDMEMHPFLEEGIALLDALTGSYRVGYWNVAAAARIGKGVDMPTDLFLKTYFVMSNKSAEMLKKKGMEIDYVTPADVADLLKNYSHEFGPHQPDSVISGR